MDDLDPCLLVDRRAMTGANSSRMRNHNQRSILSLLREQGPCAKARIAEALNLSAQTASVIVRELETQGLISRLEPVKGKVGKPPAPFCLNPGGAYSYGLRIGRRTCNLVLIDILGDIVSRRVHRYPYPTPEAVEEFVRGGLSSLAAPIPEAGRNRIAGMGIAAPFELWNWLDGLNAPQAEADKWRGYSIGPAHRRLSGLPVHVGNDGNLACQGELMFGNGSEFRDFIYFYISYFVGGAVAMDGKVFHGARGNAGGVGSMPSPFKGQVGKQLLNFTSIFLLERRLAEKYGRPINLRAEEDYWLRETELRDEWLQRAAIAMAQAAVCVAATLDISNVIVDGVFPPAIRSLFVDRLRAAGEQIDQRGIYPVSFHEGRLGPDAGEIGAAYQPILSELLVEGSRLT